MDAFDPAFAVDPVLDHAAAADAQGTPGTPAAPSFVPPIASLEGPLDAPASGVVPIPYYMLPDLQSPGATRVDLPVVILDHFAGPDKRAPLVPFHAGDAGSDLFAATTVRLGPGQRALVETGLKVAIPEGYVGLICPRSGLAHRQGVTVLNAPGIIDAGYRGEIRINLYNAQASLSEEAVDALLETLDSNDESGALSEQYALDYHAQVVEIKAGDKIAQLVIVPFVTPRVVPVEALPETGRGEAGHGSSGR